MVSRRGAAIVLAALAALAGGLLAPRPALTAIDQVQSRLDIAAPLPRGEQQLQQTFVPARNGLSSIEVLAVVYGSSGGSAAPSSLTMTLAGPTGPVAGQTFQNVAHNQSLRLEFDPERASASRAYTLTLSAPVQSTATVWSYSLDGYARGRLRFAGQDAPGDLNFSTRYTYLLPDLARDLWRAARFLMKLSLPLWLLLVAPGSLLLALFQRTGETRTGNNTSGGASSTLWIGLTPALSLCLVALAWLWAGTLGLRWSPSGFRLVFWVVGACAAVRWLLAFRHRRHVAAVPFREWPTTAALTATLALGFLPRVAAIRDLVLPQWVDGPHHYAIARLLEITGQVPPGYEPLLPVDSFSYHFGFHALAVGAHWLSGVSLADTFLWLGQALQGLVPLSAYVGVAALTHRPRAGLLAAAFVALVSYFPGYYLTWGRYTQLAGLVLLFPALASVAGLVSDKASAARQASAWPVPAQIGITALLAAGLFLTHYPLFMLWLAWVGVMAASAWMRCPSLAKLAQAGLAGAALTLPWVWRLASRLGQPLIDNPSLLTAPAGYNAFPTEYFAGPLERAWIGVALGALAAGLLRRDRLIWRVAAWCAVVGIVVNLGNGNWLVNNNTLAISLVVPGAVVIGWAGDRWLWQAERWLPPMSASASRPARPRSRVLGLVGLAMVAGFYVVGGYAAVRGPRVQAGIINPATVLVTPADRAALDWIDSSTPPDAVFAINAWEWLNGTWAGSDGGAWIWPLTGRRTTVPPADYVYGTLEQQTQINAYNRRLYAAPDLSAQGLLTLLREGGATHIYIGARGGQLRPEMFVGDEHYQLLFSNGAAWVFAIQP